MADKTQEPYKHPTALISCLKTVLLNRYFQFSGRARRREFWYFALFSIILQTVLFYLTHPTNSNVGIALYIVLQIAIIIPTYAAGTRRLHDVGKSGWLLPMWMLYLPIGIFYIIYWCAVKGDKDSNRFGAA